VGWVANRTVTASTLRPFAGSDEYRHGTVKVRPGSPALSSVRVRAWGADPGVVQLALVDQDAVPDGAELQQWLGELDGTVVHTVRTGALFPAAAERFADAGFAVIDTLALLRVELSGDPGPPVGEPPATGLGDIVTAPLRRHHHPAAAAIDRAAFGAPWSNDIDDLEEIRDATPSHHATGRFLRTSRLHRQLVGFAISGAAGRQGYLQRLAVDPACQRGGHGRALTLESMMWMRRRGLRSALVNTAITNEGALALYRSLGFRPLPEHLVVMQRAVRGG
jgi:ribosomal protein S18 acetylase RimI-like enzyme